MADPLEPTDCETCQELEESKAELRTVAKHFIAEHREWLNVLEVALAIANGQEKGTAFWDG